MITNCKTQTFLSSSYLPNVTPFTVLFFSFFYQRWLYIFIAVVLDKTSILVAVYFSMLNIYQSCDLRRALGRSNVNNVRWLLTFAWPWSRIAMTSSAGVPPPGCYKTSVRYDLIVNIRKRSPVRLLMMIYLETSKTQRFTSTVFFSGLTTCCFLFNILYCHVISNN